MGVVRVGLTNLKVYVHESWQMKCDVRPTRPNLAVPGEIW